MALPDPGIELGSFPLKNVPVVTVSEPSGQTIRQALAEGEGTAVLALEGIRSPSYRQVAELAEEILAGIRGGPVFVCLEQDMAKALGQALAVRLEKQAQVLCIDRIRLSEGSFLDLGEPVGPALPVVVKTLVLSR